MKKFATILRDIGFVCFSLFILFMIFLMSSGKHVSIAGYQVLRVLTSSMEPAISENTCIIIKKYPVDQLKVGDIIRVKVLEVDPKRGRISLTMRGLDRPVAP